MDDRGVAAKLMIGLGAEMLAFTFMVAVNVAGEPDVLVACTWALRLALSRTTTMQSVPELPSYFGIVISELVQLVGVGPSERVLVAKAVEQTASAGVALKTSASVAAISRTKRMLLLTQPT